MRYLLMIHADEEAIAKWTPQQLDSMLKDCFGVRDEMETAGAYVASERLRPTTTTLRVRHGKTVTVDGPFTEAKEQLGGYYMIDVADMDAALAWASRLPQAEFGSIEVRPIWEGFSKPS